METPGFSIWIILILVAFMFIFMWGALFLVLSVGTWFIAKARLRDDRRPPRRDDD